MTYCLVNPSLRKVVTLAMRSSETEIFIPKTGVEKGIADLERLYEDFLAYHKLQKFLHQRVGGGCRYPSFPKFSAV